MGKQSSALYHVSDYLSEKFINYFRNEIKILRIAEMKFSFRKFFIMRH